MHYFIGMLPVQLVLTSPKQWSDELRKASEFLEM